MRKNRLQAKDNRQTVIDVASRIYRRHAFSRIGLKDRMKGAGLPQGAFYKQPASKVDTAAKSSGRAMEGAAHRWSTFTAENTEDLVGVSLLLRAVNDEHLSTRFLQLAAGSVLTDSVVCAASQRPRQ